MVRRKSIWKWIGRVVDGETGCFEMHQERRDRSAILYTLLIEYFFIFHLSFHLGRSAMAWIFYLFFTVRLSCRTAGGREILHMAPLLLIVYTTTVYTRVLPLCFRRLDSSKREKDKRNIERQGLIVCLCICCCPHLLWVFLRLDKMGRLVWKTTIVVKCPTRLAWNKAFLFRQLLQLLQLLHPQ